MSATPLVDMDQKQGKNNNKGQDKDDLLDGLQPVASFECKSGVLLWGQLDTVLDAKADLKNERTFDGVKAPECGIGGTIWSAAYEFHCQAMKGRWSKYYLKADGDTEKFLFFCHDESLTPRQLVERGKKLMFSRNPDPEADGGIFVNRYDWGYHYQTPFSAKWKTSDHDVILTDPSWKLDVPRKADDEDVSSDDEEEEEGDDEDDESADGEEELVDHINNPDRNPEVLLPKLNAAWKNVGSNTIALMDSDGQDCGLLSSALNATPYGEWIYGRLIFNENKQLIGFWVNIGNPDGEPIYRDHYIPEDTPPVYLGRNPSLKITHRAIIREEPGEGTVYQVDRESEGKIKAYFGQTKTYFG